MISNSSYYQLFIICASYHLQIGTVNTIKCWQVAGKLPCTENNFFDASLKKWILC